MLITMDECFIYMAGLLGMTGTNSRKKGVIIVGEDQQIIGIGYDTMPWGKPNESLIVSAIRATRRQGNFLCGSTVYLSFEPSKDDITHFVNEQILAIHVFVRTEDESARDVQKACEANRLTYTIHPWEALYSKYVEMLQQSALPQETIDKLFGELPNGSISV